jgi:hypothetical protein
MIIALNTSLQEVHLQISNEIAVVAFMGIFYGLGAGVIIFLAFWGIKVLLNILRAKYNF